MDIDSATATIGNGSPESDLSAAEQYAIVEAALTDIEPGARVLAIIPDKTRDDNTAQLFQLAGRLLAERGAVQFDALVAQGTHRPMTEQEKLAKIGAANHGSIPGFGQIFDHEWDRPDALITLGELSAQQVSELTDGIVDWPIPLTVNRLLEPGRYDVILIFGATVPHEVAGFSGGAKYFFPGVAGPELTNATHWLGALATIERVIGLVETPTRRLIEYAASYIPARVISLNSVVSRNEENRLRVHALFAGDVKAAFRRAAEVSLQVHIKYTGRKYRRVIALLDEHYQDLWVGGKASYKLGAVIEEGGELFIYAPHMRRISETHGWLIERYGYAPLERVREMVAQSSELQGHLSVAAHLAHVTYAGTKDESGQWAPRYRITLASLIDEETCRRVRLWYMDPRQFRLNDYLADSDTLVVDHAGRDLYLVA